MKVLLVNQYYPPDTAATAFVFSDLVAALAECGHEVTVLCGRPSYDPDPASAITAKRASNPHVKRAWSTSFDRRRVLGRASNYVTFLLSAAVKLVLRRHAYDVVVAGTDPPLAVLPALLGAKGAPVVYSLQDLHPESAIATGSLSFTALTRAWDRVHRWAMQRVARLVCIGQDMADRVRGKGIHAGRIEVIPNGAPPAGAVPDQRVVDQIRGGAGFVVLHAGNVGTVGAWDTLLAAAHELRDSVSLVFVGDGVEAERLRASGIRVLPYRPVEELASVMEAGDLQAVTMRAGMQGYSVPSKLYTVLAHHRPVLAIVPDASEVAQVVRRFGCGFVADPDDPHSAAEMIRQALQDPERLKEMSVASGKAAEEYDRSRCIARFVALVESVADRGLSTLR